MLREIKYKKRKNFYNLMDRVYDGILSEDGIKRCKCENGKRGNVQRDCGKVQYAQWTPNSTCRLLIISRWFERTEIHKGTWLTPDSRTVP